MPPASECIRNVEVEIPAGEVERESTRIAQGIQKRARIPGFRPGKAPLSLVRQHFSGKIREETIETLVPAHLRAAFERESLEPVSRPMLEDLQYEPGSPLKFKASFEILPPFVLGDYRDVRAAMPSLEVSASEVEQALEHLRSRDAKFEPSFATELANGLVAVVDAVQIAPAGSPEAQELRIEVGGADTIAAFSDALRGHKVGDTVEMENQGRGYALTVKSLETKILPALDETWVKASTDCESLGQLRERIGVRLRREREHQARHQLKEAVITQLLEQTTFPVPEAMVDEQIERQLERNLRGLAEQGVDPRKLKLDWTKLRERHHDAAARDVRAALVLARIAEKEQITAPEATLEAELARAAEEVRQTPEALRARWQENGVWERMKQRLRQEQVMEFVLNLATEGAWAKVNDSHKETELTPA